ncbi:6-phosphogluconolactonase [Hymenobacter defluvii]|uniref:6-phosphogluconolactonase n=1 Tax=Hymenobacter defluvii TaxID=2054411 RepID=A0ABS3TDA2_9BACT|nr:6-phosphogluconolactonase [Hymenobacter defluvii]MBO3271623.1 6-phosphogluconolactonase [Hymenobacter defluvii]
MAIRVFKSSEVASRALAEYFVATGNEAIAARGRFAVALSGGSSPKKLFELLAADYRDQLAWDKVDFFWGDERYVPHTDPNSNYLMAKKALLDPLDIQPAQIFAVDTSLSPSEAAAAYTRTMQRYFDSENSLPLDLDLLGLGDNAHTASLFPHTSVLTDESVSVQALYIEEVQANRVTMTAPLLNQARATVFLVYGEGKAEAVRQILEEECDIQRYPAQLIQPENGNVTWFLDEAAASKLTQK